MRNGVWEEWQIERGRQDRRERDYQIILGRISLFQGQSTTAHLCVMAQAIVGT